MAYYNSPHPQQPRNRDMGNAFRSHLLNKVGRYPADEYTTNGNGSPMPGNGGIPIQPPGGGGGYSSPLVSLLKEQRDLNGTKDALQGLYGLYGNGGEGSTQGQGFYSIPPENVQAGGGRQSFSSYGRDGLISQDDLKPPLTDWKSFLNPNRQKAFRSFLDPIRRIFNEHQNHSNHETLR